MAMAKYPAAVLGLVPVLVCMGGAAPALAAEDGSARGSFSIENQELTDAETSNEVKVGCDFRIDFFGFALQSVPVTFTVMPPSGNGETLESLVATLEDPDPDAGNDLSGSLDVSLRDDLESIEPAQAQDYDFKVRMEAVVKETPGTSVTKSKILFIVCDTGPEEVVPEPVTPEPIVPEPVTPEPHEGGGTLNDSEERTSPVAEEPALLEDAVASPIQKSAAPLATLPETGASSPWLYGVAAAIMIATGWALRRIQRRVSA